MGAYKYKRMKNADPNNPFTPGTMRAALYEEDFSDLTIEQIAEVFNSTVNALRRAMTEVRAKTGKQIEFRDARTFEVKYKREQNG